MVSTTDIQISIGSYDLILDVSSFPNGTTLNVISNVGIENVCDETKISLSSDYTNQWSVALLNEENGNNVDKYYFSYPVVPSTIRVLYHDSYASVYLDDCWIYTFSFRAVYSEETSIWVTGSNTITFSKINNRELCDWREAIWIDIESTSQSAMNSIIQQRPVVNHCRYNGVMQFLYVKPTRTSVNIDYVQSHEITEVDAPNACSDGIIYYTYASSIMNEQAAEELGFITRVFRLPDLNAGAIRAARTMQNLALEEQFQHIVEARPNFVIEPEDIATILEPVAENENSYFIVEKVDYSFSLGKFGMMLRGRKYNA